MTYPNQGGYGQPGPGYGQGQGYGPANPGYAPNQGYQGQGGYGQPGPGYQNQGQPQGQPGPGPQAARGTLTGYWRQPAQAGASLSKFFQNPGQQIAGVVARPITDADIQVQTNMQSGQVQTYRDGAAKYAMVVPLLVQQSQMFPEGKAAWYVKGQARDELARAMAEAGVPLGPDGLPQTPEMGAWIQVTFTGLRQIPGMNAAKQYAIVYRRPDARANGQAPAQDQGYQQPANGNGQQGQYQGAPQDQGQYQGQPSQAPWQQPSAPAPSGYSQDPQPSYPAQSANQGQFANAQQGPPPNQYAGGQQDQGQYQGPPPGQQPAFEGQGYGQGFGQQGPGAQVASATQAGVAAAAQYQGQQGPPQGQPGYNQPAGQDQYQGQQGPPQGAPQDMSPNRQALLARLTAASQGQQGPPQ